MKPGKKTTEALGYLIAAIFVGLEAFGVIDHGAVEMITAAIGYGTSRSIVKVAESRK